MRERETQRPTTPDARETVSRSYEQALQRALESDRGSGSCCGSSQAVKPAGNAAKLVDYRRDAEGLPAEALGSSFGCGNPLAFSAVQVGQTVVDLGSGAGLDLLIASRLVGPTGRVIGIDMTDAMLDEARRNVERSGVTNVELRKGIIEALPLEDSSVDWVISNCVINLSPDKPAVFRELARVLKPGGGVSISDIVAEDLPTILRKHAKTHAACIGGAISEADYVAGLRAAGLTDVEVTERLVYEREQLIGVASLDDSADDESGETSIEALHAAVLSSAGKIWSAKFSGRMPATS